MKALISPNEPCETGYRIADVHTEGFDVAAPLFWVECANDVVPDLFWYDPASTTIKPMPVVPEPEPQPQPEVDGAETL